MTVLAPCDCGCGGDIMVGLFSEIRVPAVADDGGNLFDKHGDQVFVTLRLPRHALPRELLPGKLVPSEPEA